MKRACRQTIRRGLTGEQRRRLARLLRRVDAAPYGVSVYARGSWHAMRDARRVDEAGLAWVVTHRPSWVYPGTPREVGLFRDLASALRTHDRAQLMPGSKRRAP